MSNTEVSDIRPGEGNIHSDSPRSPDESIRATDRANVNKTVIRIDANALSIIALILSVAALVFVYQESSARERIAVRDVQVVDAKIAAAAADARASMQEQIAQMLATAQAGKEHARIALDEVQRANAQLEAKGLIRPRTH